MDCPKPKIENVSKDWTSHDEEVSAEVAKHCKRVYGDDYCARVIKKTGDNSYQVICFIPIRIQPYPPIKGDK